jgi:methanogenic corrinoid protein MtbC1
VRQLLERDEYREDFGYSIYGKIDVDWYSSVIYDFYFDDDNINDDIIDNVLVDNLEVECKENM